MTPTDGPPEARMSWPVTRQGEELLVSLAPPRPVGDRGFRPVDVLAAAGEGGASSEQLGELVRSLAHAADAGGTVAIQGFAAPRATGGSLTFTLAISLAALPYPEAGELPEGNVSQFELACGPGVRVLRLSPTESGPGQPAVTEFTATYLAQTDYGVLALAFATPHLDGAPEFSVLFDSIARSCEVGSVHSAQANAT
jgi:hypothetical protein